MVSSGLVVNLASKTADYAKEYTKRKVIMILPDKNKLEEARERFMKRFPIDRIRKIKKYRNLSNQQYLQLIHNLEKLGILLLESYIFTLNDQS